MFKFFGHSQFLEICATSKEVVLFHDNAFVMLRFRRGSSQSSSASTRRHVMVDGKDKGLPWMDSDEA